MKYVLLPLMILLSACSYEGDSAVKNPGIYECTSNTGRPTLSFDTRTLKATINPLSSVGTLSFVDLNSGMRHTIHTVEDRDYWCALKKRVMDNE